MIILEKKIPINCEEMQYQFAENDGDPVLSDYDELEN